MPSSATTCTHRSAWVLAPGIMPCMRGNSGYLLMGRARLAWEFQPGRRAGVLGGVRGMLTDTALTDFIFMFVSPSQF